LGFVQALAKFEYFMHVFNIFSHYCSKFPTLTMGKKNGTITARLNFITRALPCFTEIHKIFYIPHDAFSRMGKKRIPEDIFNLLDSIALAH
jgi:hypothetical protein